MLLHEYLTFHAKRCPGRTAVVSNGRETSYATLDIASDLLALRLRHRGVGKGDRVALLFDNSVEYVAAYFGTLKAGAVAVPLNAQTVERELAVYLEDCAPVALVTDWKNADLARKAAELLPQPPLLLVIEEAAAAGFEAAVNGAALPSCSVAEPSLAVILYTSGTTGKPKGVMLSHGNLTANALSIIEYLHLTSRDRVMAILPFYYSYGQSLLTTHIMAGGTLVLENRFIYPNLVLGAMAKEGVTGFAGVPSHFAILLRKSALRQYRLPKLRYVTQAGGPMDPAMIQEFTTLLPHAEFFVMYGQTEATARLSYLPPEYLEKKAGSVGKAVPGVRLELLKEDGEAARPGETGEIVASGANIMMGYWNAPDETAQVLKNGKLFTGDLAWQDADGFFHIVGRKKDMIKTGANRISPREIEEVVGRMPGVLECAAVGVPDELLGEAVKLFVVTENDAAVTGDRILEYCRQNLARFKVPKYVEHLSSLPRTASGKVKREELKGNDVTSHRPQVAG